MTWQTPLPRRYRRTIRLATPVAVWSLARLKRHLGKQAVPLFRLLPAQRTAILSVAVRQKEGVAKKMLRQLW